MGAPHRGINPHDTETTRCLLWVMDGCASRSTDTSDDYIALRKSAALGHKRARKRRAAEGGRNEQSRRELWEGSTEEPASRPGFRWVGTTTGLPPKGDNLDMM
jgi:hypothetical protein